jgi:serine/threonine protein kinase
MQEQGTAGAGLPEPKVWKYFIQALLGLQYIHSKKIIHRDIKSLNLFIDHNDNVKVLQRTANSIDRQRISSLGWCEAACCSCTVVSSTHGSVLTAICTCRSGTWALHVR